MFKNNLTKKDLVKDLSSRTGYSLNFSKKLIDDLIEIIIHYIKEDYFNLKNIGSFKIINKKARIGRNPKTKKEFSILPRKTISFVTSKKILDKLNG